MLSNLLPDVRTAPGVLGDGTGTAYSTWAQWIMVALILSYRLIKPILWLWWCDRPPRRVWTGVYAFFAWFAFRLTSTAVAISHVLPQLVLYVGDHDLGRALYASPSARLAHGQIPGSAFHWKLSFELFELLGYGRQPIFAVHLFMQLAERILLYGAIAVLVYVLVQHVHHRYVKSVTCVSDTPDG